MVQIFGEDDIGEFCAAEAEHRDEQFAAQAAQRRGELDQGFKGKKRRNKYIPLVKLPKSKLAARTDSMDGTVQDIVLDANVLVELLNVLPLRDQSGTRLDLSGLDEPFRTRLKPALSRDFGKLIVPASVLIETEGVIAAKRGKYENADKVLRHMAAVPASSRFAAFSFEPMAADTFAAFLDLIEWLSSARVPRKRWPALGDMLVLAHGLYNRCPVASYEWINKNEWHEAQLDEEFPFLVLR